MNEGSTKGRAIALALALLVFLPTPYITAPASANHCYALTPCNKLYPQGRHPSESMGYMWACDWPDDYHPRCSTVRAAECYCDASSGDFRDRNNLYNAMALSEAFGRCVDQNGSPSLVKNSANTDLLEWIGVECELPNGQKWFESYPTTDICYTMVISLQSGTGQVATPRIPPSWCCRSGGRC
jgi:hypothetical protein